MAMLSANTPASTYRIQFVKDFRFVDALDLVPYLHALGVSALYSSPRFRARRGSSHGYDVADPCSVNSELGTDDEFNELCDKLKLYGMGLVLDVVPNHMAASHENRWWTDVLENGPSSPYASYFDINWHPATTKASFLQENKVLLPVLGDFYGNVLDNREIELRYDETGFFFRYYEHRFPLDPKTYGKVLEYCVGWLERNRGCDHKLIEPLREVRDLAQALPERCCEPEEIAKRRAGSEVVKQRLFHVYRDDFEARLALDAALHHLSQERNDPEATDLLDAILDVQAYRLAYWKIGFEEINYRRFFDINDLVGLRVESPEVFEARHKAIKRLVGEGRVTGLRVDHIDGLHDPEEYLRRLRETMALPSQDSHFYLVAEKILGRDEVIPRSWPVEGTTGYDFLNALNDLFIDRAGLEAMEAVYARFTGVATSFAELTYSKNQHVMWKMFAGEINAFGHELGKLAARHRQARDVPLSELMQVLVEVTACLPVYRTYVRDFDISEADRKRLDSTLAIARRRTPPTQVSDAAFEFLRSVLFLQPPPYGEDHREDYLRFVMRWQQFTGPVMAKGLEDTASYIHNSLISRNDVGGDPLRDQPPLDAASFHCFNQQRRSDFPFTMNATSTHDTKRSEDARARINVLSEMPAAWEACLKRWRRWNAPKKAVPNGAPVPVPGEEILVYQSMLGAWPLEPNEVEGFRERLKGFAIKAMREAKVHSGWIRPDEAHEAAVVGFIDAILQTEESNRFLPDFLAFQERIAWHGALNALSQVLVKIASPGVPDFYQGSELWNLSLVDPDNRRPVDFARLRTLLDSVAHAEAADLNALLKDLVGSWRDGRIKLYLTEKALNFRREHRSLFLEGEYVPISSTGAKRGNVFAFARRCEGQWALAAVPLFTTNLVRPDIAPLGRRTWGDTALELPDGFPSAWTNVLTQESVAAASGAEGPRSLPAAAVFRRFPVALLEARRGT
ncbi:MAG: malto-oligosyltrehalose synthase [Bryobacteraceae bacterium]|nr:malto-oligosyltrehalose synthase [Bryobacteraceae bacterium]